MKFDLEDECAAFVLSARKVLLKLLGDPAQFGAQLFFAAHIAECAFCTYALALVFFRWADAGVTQTKVNLHEEVEGFFTKEFGEEGALGIDVATGFDTDGVEFPFEDSANAVDFASG